MKKLTDKQQDKLDELTQLSTPNGFEVFEAEYTCRIHETTLMLQEGVIDAETFDKIQSHWQDWIKSIAFDKVNECWTLWESIAEDNIWNDITATRESKKVYSDIKKLRTVFENLYWHLFEVDWVSKKRFAHQQNIFIESVADEIKHAITAS